MMIANKENLIEKREELIGVLTAISVVSRRLAGQLSALERRRDEATNPSEKAEWRSDDGEI